MTYVSEDHQTVVTASPSEPPLAMAAAAIMNHEDIRISDILKHLIQGIRKGFVLHGYRGETIAQFILLMAWDKHVTARSSPLSIKFAEPVNIHDYLRSLSILHTKKHDLLEFAKRGPAVYCKECQRGVDLMIPVLIDGNLDVELVLKDIVIIFYQVTGGIRRIRYHALFGITKELYSCLNLRQEDETLEVEKLLKELRTASVDLMQLIEDEENKAIVRHMLPLYCPKDETASKRRKT
ncbi:523_t:CDS:2 [Paraglomus occultum]|uniref:523_t:CDS:1 n=1 Tax=Paraglomus occultum TaxID=144539 RepID=A0A9N9C301_9GLOM|nr:523_t:CDS:2 [Paraglomus occultum]